MEGLGGKTSGFRRKAAQRFKLYILENLIFLDVFEFLRFGRFFRLKKKKLVFGVFLVHPTVVLVLLSASVERCFVSRMRDFCLTFLKTLSITKPSAATSPNLGTFLTYKAA